MEHITKNHSYLAAFLLMVSAIAMDEVLSSALPSGLGTSITVFLFSMCLLWICDHSGMPRMPRLSLGRKITMAGVPAIGGLAIYLFR
jgi:hypothetical protein